MKLQLFLGFISVTLFEISSFILNHLQCGHFLSLKQGNRNKVTRLNDGWDGEDDDEDDFDYKSSSINVLGTPMIPCCSNVGKSGIGTGFYRNGYCSTDDTDLGRHTVCICVT